MENNMSFIYYTNSVSALTVVLFLVIITAYKIAIHTVVWENQKDG